MLPICNSTKDFNCTWGLYNKWQKCLLQKEALAYEPVVDEVLMFDNENVDILTISAPSRTKQIVEEIDVITMAGFKYQNNH